METVVVENQKSKKRQEFFTTGELKFIKKHTIDAPKGERLSPKQLAKLPEMRRHTWQSIATRVKKHGWADPTRSKVIKSGKKLTNRQKNKLFELLSGSWRFWPSSVVAQELSLSHQQVTRFRKKKNLVLVHGEETLKDPVYRVWFEERERKRKENQMRFFSNLPTIKRRELVKRLQEFLKNHSCFKWKLCSKCLLYWPANNKFFWERERKFAKGGTYLALLTVCLACPDRKIKTPRVPVF